jgi:hypothetical protein
MAAQAHSIGCETDRTCAAVPNCPVLWNASTRFAFSPRACPPVPLAFRNQDFCDK